MTKKRRLMIYASIIAFACLYTVIYINKRTNLFSDMPYQDKIKIYSRQYSVDPLLIKALMKRESNMKVNAVSKKGAVGLMQIMPKTAQEIAMQLNIENYEDGMLNDPDINIMFGTYYLHKLLAYYNNNLRLTLAAYNAGIGNVDAWLAANPDIAQKISKMPFRETRRHTRAIIFTYSVYKGEERLKNLLKAKKA